MDLFLILLKIVKTFKEYVGRDTFFNFSLNKRDFFNIPIDFFRNHIENLRNIVKVD